MSDEAAHADFIDRTRLVFPHYWIVERSPDLTTFIVGFADTPTQYQSLLARRAAQLTRAYPD